MASEAEVFFRRQKTKGVMLGPKVSGLVQPFSVCHPIGGTLENARILSGSRRRQVVESCKGKVGKRIMSRGGKSKQKRWREQRIVDGTVVREAIFVPLPALGEPKTHQRNNKGSQRTRA